VKLVCSSAVGFAARARRVRIPDVVVSEIGRRVAVPSFADMSIEDFAFDEVAVGTIAGTKVFVQRDQGTDAHWFDNNAGGADERTANDPAARKA
jgi:hypothetical protein